MPPEFTEDEFDTDEEQECSECGEMVFDLEYLYPPTCKACVRAAQRAEEIDSGEWGGD